MDPLAGDLGPEEEEVALGDLLSSGPTFPGELRWLEETLAQVDRWRQAEEHTPMRFVALRVWLDQAIGCGGRKTLVFSQTRQMVDELAEYLRSSLGQNAVAVMTHNLEDDEIAEVARRFERRPECLVLLSDEVGAEGRNFQFADAVVHLDQPTIVARLEQRIGRLDRIGRPEDRPVVSMALIGPFALERAFLELNRDLFGVYERSIGGLEYLLPRFQQSIRTAAAGGAQTLRALAQALRPELVTEEQRVDEAFSFFLDTTRPELERAKELADLVGERTGDEDEKLVRDWCKELRVDLIPQEGNRVKVEVRVERLDSPLPALGPQDWVKVGTFLRGSALDVAAGQYFAPGHVFVDALLQSAQNMQDARSAAFFRDLGAHGRGRTFCVVVGRLGPDKSALAGGLPPGLMRRAEHYLPFEWVRSVFEIQPDGEVAPVPNGPLLNQLLKDFLPSDRKCHLDHVWQVVERFSGLWVGLRAAVAEAGQFALADKKDVIEAAANELEEALRSEFAYLRSQQDGLGADDTARALSEREALLAAVRFPSIVTDAVALVFGSEGR